MKDEANEACVPDERQWALSAAIVAALNLQHMEKRSNLDLAKSALRDALSHVNEMQRRAKCGQPVPYVIKQSKGKAK